MYAMKAFGIDFDKVTVANVVSLVMMLAYLFFIYLSVEVPTEFHDLIKIIAAFLFLSEAYKNNKNST